MMDPRTGLLPGQSWSVAAGPTWQARLDPNRRAHVIAWRLAHDPGSWKAYAETNKRRRWYASFERACRAARMHERIVIAVRRQAAQAGQGEGE